MKMPERLETEAILRDDERPLSLFECQIAQKGGAFYVQAYAFKSSRQFLTETIKLKPA
jgi:hypothetical protein